jgi:large conductance mechanosensitive channel
MVLKEFREFIARGNVMDMAVGIIIGAAFGAIVNSLVNDVVMPPIGLLLGKVDFSNMFIVLRQGATPGPYPSLAAAKAAGAVSINVGLFINAAVSFVIVALSVFLMVKAVNQLKRTWAAAALQSLTKPCPRCCSDIPAKATRCPHCTSELGQRGQA